MGKQTGFLLTLFVLQVAVMGGAQAMEMGGDAPPDPFDYSYCGGKPVYPVIGFNFATACGPRNQIGLGRRGRLMWLFTTADGRAHASGNRNLTDEEAGELMLLAEAAQLAAAPAPATGAVRYDLGINFTGRRDKRAHGVLYAHTDSVQALFDAMKRLVPAEPLLPECTDAPADFSPTRLPHERRAGRENRR
jgi:hypothetical protein